MSEEMEERLAAIEARLKRLEEQLLWHRPMVPPKGPRPTDRELTAEERQAMAAAVRRSKEWRRG
jgi:hypothetical protein